MPRFSIVIPTYNRAKFIAKSIESALNQRHDDLEVIVSDNASTDETAEVVQRFGDRVRYHRNETNLGMWGNFALGPSLATGEYFSWLTDDDFIRNEFVARAIRGLSVGENVQLYTCWAAYTASATSVKKYTTIHGPLFPIDWLASEATIVDGLVFVPFSFFESQAMPPAVAMRTAAAREGVKSLLPNCVQFNEYVLAAAVAARCRVAIDPWVGVLHMYHDSQAHNLANLDKQDILRQKRAHAQFCQELIPTLPPLWKDLFRDTLNQLPVETRVALLANSDPNPEDPALFWGSAPPVVLELRNLLIASLPEGLQADLQRAYRFDCEPGLKNLVKRAIPVRIRKTVEAARWTWKSYQASS